MSQPRIKREEYNIHNLTKFIKYINLTISEKLSDLTIQRITLRIKGTSLYV